MVSTRIIKECMAVSSDTMAGLIGSNRYDYIDQVRDAWVMWVAGCTHDFANWIDAWRAYEASSHEWTELWQAWRARREAVKA